MEWIIGAIVVWILWRLITGKPRREATLQDAISRAFISNQHGQEWIKTPIYWDAARLNKDIQNSTVVQSSKSHHL
jgi:hypothetical protein